MPPAAPGGALEVLEDMAGGAPEFEGRFSGDRLDVGGAPDAVRAKNAFLMGTH
jgi:hypothetical protein